MPRKLVASLALLFTFILATVVESQSIRKWEKFTGATFRINQYGILEELKDINGDNYLGKNAPSPHDGYAVAYQILPAKIGKLADRKTSKANVQIVYATSEKISTNLLKTINNDNALSGEIKPSVKGCEKLVPDNHCKLLMAEVQTSDGVLKITNEFWGLGPKNELGIARRIKNLSKTPVQLLALEIQLDQRLYPPIQPSNTPNTPHHETRSLPAQSGRPPLPGGDRSGGANDGGRGGGGANDGGRGGGGANDGNRDRSRNSLAVFRDPWVTGPVVCPPWFDSAIGNRDRLRIREFPSFTEVRCKECSQVVFREGELPEPLLEKLDCETQVETNRWTFRKSPKTKTAREPIILKPGEMVAIFTTPKLLKPSK